MDTFISHSAAETEAFAAALGAEAESGLVVGLTGDLGAGKTQFVKGLARGLGVTERVLSPTFALLHCYTSGRLPLYHIDLYRLTQQREIIEAGLDEYFTPKGVTVVEWWSHWQGQDPFGLRRFTLERLSDTVRRLTYDPP